MRISIRLMKVHFLALIFALAGHHCFSQPAVRAPAAKVDRYGDPLPAGAIMRLGTVRLRHSSSVSAVVFSPDGRMIVSAGWGTPVYFWDAKTAQPLAELEGVDDQGARGLAFSPDGTKLATAGDNGWVRLWDVAGRKEMWNKKAHRETAYAVAFSPDGLTFATTGTDGTVRLWDVASGKELWVLNVNDRRGGDGFGLCISPDGSLLACGGNSDIFLYNLKEGGERRVIAGAHGRGITSLAFTPDGKLLASGGRSVSQTAIDAKGQRVSQTHGEVKLWNVAEGTLAREFLDEKREANGASITLSADGKMLVSISLNKIQLWDVVTGTLIRTFGPYYNSFGQRTNQVAISPDGTTIAALGGKQSLLLWDVATGNRKLDFIESHDAYVTDLGVSPDGNVVATSAYDGSVRLWNRRNGLEMFALQMGEVDPRGVHVVTFSPDGRFVAAGGYDWKDRGNSGLVCVWRVEDGVLVFSAPTNGRVTGLAYSSDGATLAAGAGMGERFPGGAGRELPPPPTIYLWESASGQEIRHWPGTAFAAKQMRFSDDTKQLVVTDEESTTSIYDVAAGKSTKQFELPRENRRTVHSAAFSPNGELAAIGSYDSEVRFYNLAEIKETGGRIQIENATNSVVTFSPDGKTLATGSRIVKNKETNRAEWVIALWNVESGKKFGSLSPLGYNVQSLAFTPDGRHLLSGMIDGTTLVWDVSELMRSSGGP